MTRTKKTGQMTSEAAKEIAEKIDSLKEQDLLTAAIGQLEHPGHVRAAGVGVTIKQYFRSAPRSSRSSSSMAPEELEQLTQQIRDQLEESITEKVTWQLIPSRNHRSNHRDLHYLRNLSTKGSCVDPSSTNPDTGDSNKCVLYIEENPSHLIALGRVYEGSTTIHNIPLLHGQVKVGVEEVKDAEASVPVPTDEAVVSPAKPPDRPDHEVEDPLYLMTFTIPQLFLKHLQVMWDATVFGVFNEDFPLYIKHEDLSEIAHGGQSLSISVIQLWILHLTETSRQAGNFNVYGFLEPQSIQRSGQSQFESESYMKSWMQSSKCDVYLGAYLNWPDNYLKGIINMSDLMILHNLNPRLVLGGLLLRQKGSTECGYYVMHWMSTIILGSFKNNWEMTIGRREIEGASHPVGTILPQS
ncbi:hypothetical protein GmHk_09G025920 [Glycine max]|nr:hypothetical protein GmHk_09G025920 [Glycine max]